MKLLIFVGLFVSFGFTAFVGLAYLPVEKVYPSFEPLPITFRIDKNESIKSVSTRLKNEKLILNSSLFEYVARFRKLDKAINYGEFSLISTMSIVDILTKISSSSNLKYNIYIKNCITNWELLNLMKEKQFLHDDLSNYSLEEGTLAPDTYIVSYKTRVSDFFKIMRAKQSEILIQEWNSRKPELPLHSQHELLVLASMIEKEAATHSEMPIIASVFINRLRKKMRLQSDPTVSYGIDLGNLDKRKPLTKSDLRNATPHNTYRIPGLPISSICNPSKSSIHAAANPIETDYLYFVMSEHGQHVFSKTFYDHKRNVLKWRKFQSQSHR